MSSYKCLSCGHAWSTDADEAFCYKCGNANVLRDGQQVEHAPRISMLGKIKNRALDATISVTSGLDKKLNRMREGEKK